MADSSNVDTSAGWEHLFQSGHFPPRFQTLADPNTSVVAWADTLPSRASVLDVGCGIGRHVVYLGERGFIPSGVDLSPLGVQTTREVCAERNIPFDGRVAHMTALPWPDATFDAVVTTSTIAHLRRADIFKTMAEIRRVLKPGGFLLADFLHKGTRSYEHIRQQAATGEVSEIEPNTFADESSHPDIDDDAFLPHHYSDEAELHEFCSAFEIIRIWAELPATSDGSPPQRGYWVASVRKPLSD